METEKVKPTAYTSTRANCTFCLYCCSNTCGCQQYKSTHFCHGNAAVGSLDTVLELKIFLTSANNVNIFDFK